MMMVINYRQTFKSMFIKLLRNEIERKPFSKSLLHVSTIVGSCQTLFSQQFRAHTEDFI